MNPVDSASVRRTTLCAEVSVPGVASAVIVDATDGAMSLISHVASKATVMCESPH